MEQSRFTDENKRLSEFQTLVIVVCPQCACKAVATVNYTSKMAQLICEQCGFNKRRTIVFNHMGNTVAIHNHAAWYFNAELWLNHPFKDDVFWVYNYEHLEYLELYISAKLRQSKNRMGFTLLERLPKFYHEAKNRDSLLKIIRNLKDK